MSAQTTDTSDVIEGILKEKSIITMDVGKMDEKIKSFQPGSKISSKDFKIGMSTFCIDVYPGGFNGENDKFVGLFLVNKSGWRVKVKGSFAIPQTDISRALAPVVVIKSRLGRKAGDWGFKKMIPHYRCVKGDLLSEIGTLTFDVSVELIGEELLHGDPPKEHMIERLEKLEQQTAELERMIQEGRDPPKELMIERLEKLEQQAAELERMRRMRLKECGQGHIICDTCQSRAEARASDEGERGNLNIANCHSCRGMITGRPAALERVLGLI